MCPGYRAHVDLIFRDQSKNVIRKAKAYEARKSARRCPPKSQHPAPEEAGLQSKGEHEISQQQAPGHIFTLGPTLEHRAMCYFVCNYVVGIQVPGYSDFDKLALLYVSNITDATLVASGKAASLAAYAYHVRSPELAHASRYQYMKAIQLTNSALGSPADAIKDSTLLSVILLGHYEVLTGRNQRSMKAWAEHVHGAATLVKLRGHEQFRTPVGRRIFIQATSSMLTSCMQRGIRLPDHIMEMTKSLAEIIGDTNPALRIYQTMQYFNEFRCDIKDGTISDPQAILARAMYLDESLVAACDNYPSEWRFHVFSRKELDPQIMFNGCYHVYLHTWVATVWNSIRVYRILIHQHIRDTLLKGFAANPPRFTRPEHTSQFQRSTEICYEMQADILASVPQLLGYVRKSGSWNVPSNQQSMVEFENSNSTLDPASPNASSTIPFASADRAISGPDSMSNFPWDELLDDEPMQTHIITKSPMTPSSTGFLLLWPLWLAGFMDLATKDVQAYCIENLQRIGQDMGIQQAFLLAKLIETKTEPEVWSQDAQAVISVDD